MVIKAMTYEGVLHEFQEGIEERKLGKGEEKGVFAWAPSLRCWKRLIKD